MSNGESILRIFREFNKEHQAVLDYWYAKLAKNIKTIEYISDRLLPTMFQFKKTTTTPIISVYAPDVTKAQQERNNFFNNLQHILDKLLRQDKIILLDDFNARVGNEVIRRVKSRFKKQLTKMGNN